MIVRIAAALSAVLFAASGVWWVVGLFSCPTGVGPPPQIRIHKAEPSIHLISRDGRTFELLIYSFHGRKQPTVSTLRNFGGFLVTTAATDGLTAHEIHIPAWFPLLIFAALPVFQFIRWRRRRLRVSRNQCLRCAYDLTGNTSGVCPECGLRLAHLESTD